MQKNCLRGLGFGHMSPYREQKQRLVYYQVVIKRVILYVS
jgi:hypothetical protein